MPKRKAWTYSLQIKAGAIGRDKKPRLYAFTIAETDTADKKQLDDLIPLITAKLKEVNYKYGELVLVEYPLDLQEHATHSGKAYRSKEVLVRKGEVLWRKQGANLKKE